MKMAKTILLGTAAALVGTVGASAADLRAAPPVQFVQVCDAAGAGFWVLPGTDVCVKVGGFVFAAYAVRSQNIAGIATNGQNGATALRVPNFFGVPGSANNGVFTPNPNPTSAFGASGRLRTETFQRTDFGILRTDILLAGDNDAIGQVFGAQGNGFVLRRAQATITNSVGVFTFGLADSFFNQLGLGSNVVTGGHGAFIGDTIGNPARRTPLIAYTAVLAPNLTATVALEQGSGSNNGTTAGNTGALSAAGAGFGGLFGAAAGASLTAPGGAAATLVGGAPAGTVLPDVVANVVWGTGASGNYVMLSGALVQNRVFASGSRVVSPAAAGQDGRTVASTGYALAVLGSVNLDMISRGSRFSARAAFSDGATQYLGAGVAASYWVAGAALGTAAGGGGQINAPGTIRNVQGWAFSAQYLHQWNAQWRSTIYAGVAGFNYRGNQDLANVGGLGGNIFGNLSQNVAAASFLGLGNGAFIPANNTLVGWNATNSVRASWNAGTALIWTPVNGFTMGVDLWVTQARFANTFGGNASGIGSTRTGWGGTFGVGRSF
jgi:hypothetical protein